MQVNFFHKLYWIYRGINVKSLNFTPTVIPSTSLWLR